MFTGKGVLVLRGGRRLAVEYGYIETEGRRRAGHFSLDKSVLEPAAFFENMELRCEDGVQILVAVTSHSDRNATFIEWVGERPVTR